MKAIVYKKQHPNKLEYCDVEKPLPKDDEAIVKVYYSSINAADYRSMQMGIIPKNKIFGSAVSGKIESIGKNVLKFKVGDEVLADLSDIGFGGLAEYIAIPEKVLAKKLKTISFETASTLPVAATTALKALRDIGNVKQNQDVLIVGAAGGVGSFAVQLAKYYGANVTAVCSTKNIEQTKALGADSVIDYTIEDFSKTKKRYDLILGINGNYSLLAYKRLLSQKGIYVMVGGAFTQILKSIFFGWFLSFGKKKMRVLSAKADPKDLEFIALLVQNNTIRPVIEKRYPLENLPEAITYLKEGHAKGKVTIQIEIEEMIK